MGNISSFMRLMIERTWLVSMSLIKSLDEVDKAQMVVDNTPLGHTDLAIRLDELADKLINRFNKTDDIKDLERAIENAKRAVDITSPGHPHLAIWLNNLANVLSEKYSRFADIHDLEDAIRYAQMAVDMTLPNDDDLCMRLSNLAVKLMDRCSETGSMADLEAAFNKARQAVDISPSDHAGLAVWLNNLANIVAFKYNQTGDPRDLEDAISNAQRAVDITPPDDAHLATYLSNLAKHLSDRHKLIGDANDLENAIAYTQRAVEVTPVDHPLTAMWLSNLGAELQDRYNTTANIKDLEKAISHTQQAINNTPIHDPQLALRRYNLSTMLLDRYSRKGDTSDLDVAISMARGVVDMMSSNDTSMGRRLNSLAAMLAYRYDRAGNTADLEYAISLMQQAIGPHGHPDSAMRLSNLANLLLNRYDRFHNPSDLADAIINAEKAIHSTPEDHPERPTWLANLAIKLMGQYKRTGDTHALDDAITNTQIAIAATPPDHPDLAMRLSNLAEMLTSRYSQNGRAGDLREAIHNARRAVDLTPPDHPEAALWLCRLANSLSETGNSHDRKAAIGYYANACDARNTLPLQRIQAARRQIRLLLEQHDLPKASRVASKVVPLLPMVCSRYLSRRDQQHGASQTAGLAADACSLALCLEPPDVRAALEHIEYGRGMILGHLMDNRDDLADVEEKSKDLAEACRALRAKVERVGRNRHAIDGTLQAGARAKIWREREQAVKDLEDCQEQIRTLLGYESFPPRLGFDDIRRTAEEGPVVIVNATDIRCDAIIVQSEGGIMHVELPHMKSAAPPRFQDSLLRHRAVEDCPPRYNRELDEDDYLESEHQAAEDYLAWLWSHCVEQVLARLELQAASPGSSSAAIPPSNLSRVWWIGTGAASALPFHAARRYNVAARHMESTLSRVISSYTPTLKALIYSRTRASRRAAPEDFPVLLVAMPSGPGLHALPAVEAEKEAIKAAMHHHRCDVLIHPTAEEVLGGLRDHAIIHFACHGKADHVDPSNSYLLLQSPDKRGGESAPSGLTASMISDEMSLGGQRGAWIAYLSACSTAEIRASQLADEGLHLAASFQMAGFTHVIGTMQPVDDDACATVAGFFYRYLVANRGAADANRLVAEALHSAVSDAHSGGIPIADLAPYIHLGA